MVMVRVRFSVRVRVMVMVRVGNLKTVGFELLLGPSCKFRHGRGTYKGHARVIAWTATISRPVTVETDNSVKTAQAGLPGRTRPCCQPTLSLVGSWVLNKFGLYRNRGKLG